MVGICGFCGKGLWEGSCTDGCFRWREAFDARKNHPDGEKIVPKIFLNATNEKALGKVQLDELRQFAADKED